MSKLKLVIFILLVVVFFVVIGPSFILNKIKNINPTNPVTKIVNPTKEYILSSGDYIVGKDIETGLYDVESLSDNIHFNSFAISKGQKLINQDLTNNSHVSIKSKGKGRIKLSPAKYEKLPKVGNNYQIEHSGYYIIGKQIPSGKYIISYTIKNSSLKNKKPFIQVFTEFRGNPLKTYQFSKKEYNLSLEDGNVLQVKKTFDKEEDNIIVRLTPK
ncbi:hypothetical protein ABGT22_19660 [Peribacillus frigoritolerans]|uniref:hypothetical protein n=1 Tax=Peribacillus frigoritolerans TaxID=450367 RepID=UPI00345D0B53